MSATPEQKHRARAAVMAAKKSGELVPPEQCERCNRTPLRPLHAHHDDYERPLEVRWLCMGCHWDLHRMPLSARLRGEDCPIFAAVKAVFGVEDLDVPALLRFPPLAWETVQNWKRRGIPPWTLQKFIALAEQRGLDVPADLYAAAQRRTKRAISGYERSAA